MNPSIFVDLIGNNSKLILTQDSDATILSLKKRTSDIELVDGEGNSDNVFYGEISRAALAKLRAFDDLTVIYRDVTPDEDTPAG